MTGFDMENSDEELFNRDYEMMNYAQLAVAIDSLEGMNDSLSAIYKSSFYSDNIIYDDISLAEIMIDTNISTDIVVPKKINEIIKLKDLSTSSLNKALSAAQSRLRGKKDFILMSNQLENMRRTNFDETNDLLQTKVNRALENNLSIIFCCGESLL